MSLQSLNAATPFLKSHLFEFSHHISTNPFAKLSKSKLIAAKKSKQLKISCGQEEDYYLLDAPESIGDGFSFSGGKYADGDSPADEWFKQGKMVKACVVRGSGDKAKEPIFGLKMASSSQLSDDIFRWFCVESGSTDKPSVLLIHGFPSQAYSYRKILPILSKDYHVIAFDWLGFGFSDKPLPKNGFDYTMEEYTASLKTLIDDLVPNKVSLVAQGYFSPVVVKYAFDHQDRVNDLILLNPPVTVKHANLPSSLSIFSNFLLGEIFSQDPLRASDKALTSSGPYKMKEDDAMVYRRPYLTSGSSGFALNAVSRTMKKQLKSYVEEMRKILMSEDWKVRTTLCSCTPSPSVFNGATTIDNHNHASPYLFSSKSVVFNNPLNQGFGGNNGFFTDNQMSTGNGVLSGFAEFSTQTEMGGPNLGNGTQFGTPQMLHFGGGSSSGGVGDDGEGFVVGGSALASRFRGFDQGLGSNSEFGSRNSKMLKPLDTPAPGAQPTLFQKRAALRKNDGGTNSNSNVSGDMVNMSRGEGQNGKRNSGGDNEKKRKFGNVGVVLDTVSLDGSFNYDSDDFAENSNFKLSGGGGSSSGGGGDDGGKIGGGTNSNNTSTVTGGGVGDSKGKKKGMPAKNLMAERRRRKKLNDRLYMLRSVVPKISKMDRASILGDAIDYLKELLQKINDIHNELESTPPAMAHTSNFHPLTPTLPNLPPRIKEELCSSSMPSPNGQPARVEVRLREGRAVNIHMFCGRKPGLLLSTMRALDGLGLDIQQAVISCFNGFALDIFRAEQCKEGQDLHPDQVKAMLLELATFHGSALLGNGNM